SGRTKGTQPYLTAVQRSLFLAVLEWRRHPNPPQPARGVAPRGPTFGRNRAMAGPPDYYEILQVSPNADDEVIQAAFKRLALKWHPDRRPGDPSAAEWMTLLNTAYAVLSDPEKRKAYDARRRQAAAPAVAAAAAPEKAERPAKAHRREHTLG